MKRKFVIHEVFFFIRNFTSVNPVTDLFRKVGLSFESWKFKAQFACCCYLKNGETSKISNSKSFAKWICIEDQKVSCNAFFIHDLFKPSAAFKNASVLKKKVWKNDEKNLFENRKEENWKKFLKMSKKKIINK